MDRIYPVIYHSCNIETNVTKVTIRNTILTVTIFSSCITIYLDTHPCMHGSDGLYHFNINYLIDALRGRY